MKLSAVLARIGLAPRTLPVAKEALDDAKATLEQFRAQYAAAGLDAEALLDAGPDALKAHIASFENSAEVAQLTAKLETAAADLTSARAEVDSLKAAATQATTTIAAQTQTIATAKTIFASVGFNADLTTTTDPAAFKAQFEKHAKESAALELAKAGHPPVKQGGGEEVTVKTMTHAAFSALTPGAKSRFCLAGGRIEG